MYRFDSLPGDVMFTSVKSCRSPTKIFIKILHEEKRYSPYKFILKFPNKTWNCRGLDHLIKKIGQCDLIARKSGSGRPQTACHGDSINAVADLVQSQENRLQTHHICGHFEHKL